MAKEKKPAYRTTMTEGKRDIIRQLLQEYDITTAHDIEDALRDLLGGTIKEMMEAEMDDHLGYQKSERSGRSVHWMKFIRSCSSMRFISLSEKIK